MQPSGNEPPEYALAELARAQHGVVALRQLRELGWTSQSVKTAVLRGRLVRVHEAVYAVGHHPLGVRTRWMAGTLAGGPDAVLSHTSAGALSGLCKAGRVIHVTRPRQAKDRDDLRFHRTSNLSGADHTVRDNIPVTAIPRTIIDCADILAPAEFAATVERVPLLDAQSFHRALDRHPGRHATKPLRTLLALYEQDAPTRSHLERAFLALCRTHAIPRPLVNERIAGHERDFAWPHARLVIEVDGGAFHATRAQRANDTRRDLELNLAGWRTQRFTYEQVVLDPAGTADALRALTSGRTALQ